MSIARFFIVMLATTVLTGCVVHHHYDKPTDTDSKFHAPQSDTQGVYQPFATDNVVPYAGDNDEDYYPLYYYY